MVPDRVGDQDKYNRDCTRLFQERRSHWCAPCQNHVWLQPNKLLCKHLNSVCVASRPAIVDPEIAALCPTRFFELTRKRRQLALVCRIALRKWHQHGDPSYPVELLRIRRERPHRRRTAENCDELAPPHDHPRRSERSS